MTFDLQTIMASTLSAGGVGGMTLWMIKRYLKRFERLEERFHEFELKRAKINGESAGELKLLWRDVDTNKRKLIKALDSSEKAWRVITRIADKMGLKEANRTSDKVTKDEI